MTRKLGKRRLVCEQLEDRRLLAITVNAPASLTVNEGETLTLANVSFADTSPAGNYAANVDWGDARLSKATVTKPNFQAGRIKVRIDYTHAPTSFFTANVKNILQTAFNDAVSRFNDTLSGIPQPTGANTWTAKFENPSSAANTDVTVKNLVVAANEIVVYVGAKKLGSGEIGRADWGKSVSGTAAWLSMVDTRGESNVRGTGATDYAPWGGSLSFDIDSNWYFGISPPDAAAAQKIDFYSTAQHELLHILGFDEGVDSFKRLVNGSSQFTGPKATQTYDGTGSPPMTPFGHLVRDTTDDGHLAAMTPNQPLGVRVGLTELDLAVMDDIGWEILSAASGGKVTADHVYADNGTFRAEITVAENVESGTDTIQVTVRNVAPLLAIPTVADGGNGKTTLSGTFTDAGSADTHTVDIEWGDGTTTSISRNSGQRSYNATKTFATAGDFTIQVTVTDDDGGQATRRVSRSITTPKPVANNDSKSLGEGVRSTLPVLANDQQATTAIDTNSLEIVTPPKHGKVVRDIAANGFIFEADLGYIGTDSFTYRVADGDGNWSNTATVQLTMQARSFPYQNPRNRLDVNHNNEVSATDVVRVVNELLFKAIAGNSGVLPAMTPTSVTSDFSYLDVNPDGKVSPTDVVQIVNALLNDSSSAAAAPLAATVIADHTFSISVGTNERSVPSELRASKFAIEAITWRPHVSSSERPAEMVAAPISTRVHQEISLDTLAWQDGHAALTVSASSRPVVQKYIANQEPHHHTQSLVEDETVSDRGRSGLQLGID